MGFKITHPLLPSRLLVWPPWHTSTWRLHVPPDRISGTSDTTKWPQCLHFHFVLSIFLISSLHLPHLEGECFFHTFLIFQGGCFKPVDNKYSPLVPVSVFRAAFHFMLLSVYWLISVFECHYTCGHQGYRSWGVFCLSSFWIDFPLFEHIQQTDSPTWLEKGNTTMACKDIELWYVLTLL